MKTATQIELERIEESLCSIMENAVTLAKDAENGNDAKVKNRLHENLLLPIKNVLARVENLDAQFSLRKSA